MKKTWKNDETRDKLKILSRLSNLNLFDVYSMHTPCNYIGSLFTLIKIANAGLLLFVIYLLFLFNQFSTNGEMFVFLFFR